MYVIAGVSGHTGSVVATTLLAAKQPVRVIVRDAAKGAPWKAKGAEVAIADLGDQAALARALAGATGAYLLLPPPAWTATHIASERAEKISAITAAVATAKPKHVVLLSSIGADLPSGTGPIRYLHQLEDKLRTTGVPLTALRASSFMENWGAMLKDTIAGGALYYGVREGVKWDQVATADIGRTAAQLLVEGPRGDRVVELAGPEPKSVQDTAAILAKLSGKPVNGVSVPVEAMVQALTGQGASPELAADLGEMVTAVNRGALKFQATPLRGTITLEQRLRELLA